MITLYRRTDPSSVSYWEAWQSEPRVVTLHRGEVGEIGLTAAVRVPLWKSADKVLAAEIAEARADGYGELVQTDHVQVVVQFDMGEDPAADLALVTAAEGVCEEVLGWTGNGRCDGHDLGAGTMTIFNETVLPQVAVVSLAGALAQAGHDTFEIAVHDGEKFRVVWPEDGSGE